MKRRRARLLRAGEGLYSLSTAALKTTDKLYPSTLSPKEPKMKPKKSNNSLIKKPPSKTFSRIFLNINNLEHCVIYFHIEADRY